MNFRQLHAFGTVADELHFGRAADRLHLAQPHLSRMIKGLEEDLGVALFARTTRRVELTPAGSALVEWAQLLVGYEREARQAVVAAQQGRVGRVRIGFSGPSAHRALGTLARAVRERDPMIDLEYQPGRYGHAAVGDLRSRTSDVVLARLTEAPLDVASRVIAEDRFVFALPEGHPLAGGGPVRLVDLRDESFVAFPESFGSTVRTTLVTQLRALGGTPRYVQTAPDTLTSIALVAAGAGVHFTTMSAVGTLPLDGVRIAEIADPLPVVEVYLIWRSGDLEPAVARVLATAEEVLPSPDDPAADPRDVAANRGRKVDAASDRGGRTRPSLSGG
ncbi:MAG: hypothetical protein ABS81_00860 [Pseudonocardia sp. SCN 72-86]|nr:MAG: hypothetical protein ABS81_00860 [Pseudonocardia sp. SCN 72-86]